jgi:3-oxoacyl-[acyl-carrier-protein] synthase II
MDTLPMKRAMQGAMSDAGVGRVSAVSANGSASVMYDPLEARAIEEHFGSSVPPVYSIKGGLGQTGAVTPVLQVIAAARTATMGLAPPTVNCEHPEVSLDIVRDGARRLGPGPVLCQAIGFGGHYFGASVVGAAT